MPRRISFFHWLMMLMLLTAAASGAGLIENPGMEEDADGDDWPDGWPTLKAGGSWEEEDGNHFLRITSTSPGKMVMLYREIPIPEGTEALELTWRQRVSDLKVGEQPWFDVRIMMEWMDSGRGKVDSKPKAPNRNRDTKGWEEKSVRIEVPAAASILKFMPTLFQVESGTLDLDDVQLTPVK